MIWLAEQVKRWHPDHPEIDSIRPETFAAISNGFGYSVDITEDGRTLKVNSRLPRGEDSNYEGRTHIYDFDGTTWRRTATIGPALPGYYCTFVRMSGDGTTLTSLCYQYSSEEFRLTTRRRSGNVWVLVGNQAVGPYGSDQMVALSFDGRTLALREGVDEKSVGIYRWAGDSWTRESVISNQELFFPNMGHKVEFSRNAARVAIGDFQAGVAIHERTGNAVDPWRLRSVVRPPPGSGAPYFGSAISLSGSGYYLAVGAFGERSNATGIDGDRFNASAENAGAVFLY